MDTFGSLAAETLSKAANPTTRIEVPMFVARVIKNLRYSLPEAVAVLKGKKVTQKSDRLV